MLATRIENDLRLRDKMKAAKKEDGTPCLYLASGLSLMIFYVFAMQCMSTLAVVKRETKTWKWPIIQLIYMTGLGLYDEFDGLSSYLSNVISLAVPIYLLVQNISTASMKFFLPLSMLHCYVSIVCPYCFL